MDATDYGDQSDDTNTSRRFSHSNFTSIMEELERGNESRKMAEMNVQEPMIKPKKSPFNMFEIMCRKTMVSFDRTVESTIMTEDLRGPSRTYPLINQRLDATRRNMTYNAKMALSPRPIAHSTPKSGNLDYGQKTRQSFSPCTPCQGAFYMRISGLTGMPPYKPPRFDYVDTPTSFGQYQKSYERPPPANHYPKRPWRQVQRRKYPKPQKLFQTPTPPPSPFGKSPQSPCPCVKQHNTLNTPPTRHSSLLGGSTIDSSHLPICRPINASPQRPLDGTFDVSSQYPMNSTYNTSSSSPFDGTFSMSPQSPINATYDTSPQRGLAGTFNASPQRPMNTTFDGGKKTSPCGQINTTFDAQRTGPRPGRLLDATFSASPELVRTKSRPCHPLDATFVGGREAGAGRSRPIDTTFNGQASPRTPFQGAFQVPVTNLPTKSPTIPGSSILLQTPTSLDERYNTFDRLQPMHELPSRAWRRVGKMRYPTPVRLFQTPTPKKRRMRRRGWIVPRTRRFRQHVQRERYRRQAAREAPLSSWALAQGREDLTKSDREKSVAKDKSHRCVCPPQNLAEPPCPPPIMNITRPLPRPPPPPQVYANQTQNFGGGALNQTQAIEIGGVNQTQILSSGGRTNQTRDSGMTPNQTQNVTFVGTFSGPSAQSTPTSGLGSSPENSPPMMAVPQYENGKLVGFVRQLKPGRYDPNQKSVTLSMSLEGDSNPQSSGIDGTGLTVDSIWGATPPDIYDDRFAPPFASTPPSHEQHRRRARAPFTNTCAQHDGTHRTYSLLERSALSQREYDSLLATPRMTRSLDTPRGRRPRRYRFPCRPLPLSPRLIELSQPPKKRVLCNWKDYESIVSPEIKERYKNMLTSGNGLDPNLTRAYFKRLDKKKRAKARRRRKMRKLQATIRAQMDRRWLVDEVDALAHAIMIWLERRPIMALNHKEMLLADQIMREFQRQSRCAARAHGPAYSDALVEISDKLAKWAEDVNKYIDTLPVDSRELLDVVRIPSLESVVSDVYEEAGTEEMEGESEGEEQYMGEGPLTYLDEAEDFDAQSKGIDWGALYGEGGEGGEDSDYLMRQLSEDILAKLIRILSSCSDEYLETLIDEERMPNVQYKDVLAKLIAIRDKLAQEGPPKIFLEEVMIDWAMRNKPAEVDDKVLKKIHETARMIAFDFDAALLELMKKKAAEEAEGETDEERRARLELEERLRREKELAEAEALDDMMWDKLMAEEITALAEGLDQAEMIEKMMMDEQEFFAAPMPEGLIEVVGGEEEEVVDFGELHETDSMVDVIKRHQPSTVFEHSPGKICCLSLKIWAVWLLQVTHNVNNWGQWLMQIVAQIREYVAIIKGEVLLPNGERRILYKEEWRNFAKETEEMAIAWRQYSAHVKKLSDQIIAHFHGKPVECCPKCLRDHLVKNVTATHETFEALADAINCMAYWRKCLDEVLERATRFAGMDAEQLAALGIGARAREESSSSSGEDVIEELYAPVVQRKPSPMPSLDGESYYELEEIYTIE